MGISSGEAYANFIGAVKKSERGISSDLFDVGETFEDVQSASGWGRGILSLVGAALGSVVPGVGTAIGASIGAGIGSKVGSEAGEYLAKRGERTNVQASDYLFGQGEIEESRRKIKRGWEGIDRAQNWGVLSDMATAYVMAPQIGKGVEGAKAAWGASQETGASLFDALKAVQGPLDTMPGFKTEALKAMPGGFDPLSMLKKSGLLKTKELIPFKEAFAKASAQGLKTFIWNKKEYTTEQG